MGAKGHQGLLEKDLTLVLCKRMATELEKSGIQVLLTRNEDREIPLASRTAYANSHQADIFISVHLNASPSSRALGTETYYHSTEATDQWAKTLAERENTIPGYQAQRDGLALVLWDLAQTQYIVESARLAEVIQGKFNELLSVRDRGVRQAPFAVLEGAQMPAVLLEVAFITNPKEAELLIDEEFQGRVASTLSAAIKSFKAAFDRPVPISGPEE